MRSALGCASLANHHDPSRTLMLRTVFVLGLVALAPLLPAQETDAPEATEPVTVSLAPSWKVGDAYALELTKTRQQSQGNREGKAKGTVTSVQVEVLEEHADGYTIGWTLGESVFIGSETIDKSVVDELANLFQGSTLQLRTDAFGTPSALLNEEEVRAQIDELLERVSEFAIAEGAPPAEMQQVLDATRSMLEGPALSAMALKEPQVYYFACGMQLELGVVQEFEESLPNPFGGAPFPGTTELLLESVDQAANSAVLLHRLELDPVQTRRIMLETFTKLAQESGAPAPRASDLPDFSIVDESAYELNLATGLPRTVTHVRTVSAAGTSQVDRLSFVVIPPAEPEAVPAEEPAEDDQ